MEFTPTDRWIDATAFTTIRATRLVVCRPQPSARFRMIWQGI
jgi:hypothetical protein